MLALEGMGPLDSYEGWKRIASQERFQQALEGSSKAQVVASLKLTFSPLKIVCFQ